MKLTDVVVIHDLGGTKDVTPRASLLTMQGVKEN